jgi:hypothetical protein
MTMMLKTKTMFLFAIGCMTAAPMIATAQTSTSLAGLYVCEQITNKADQLTCFLTETAKLRSAETSGDLIAVDKESFEDIKKSEVEKAETKRVEKVKEKTAKKRTLAIQTATTYGANDYIRFTLVNGEVWQQIEPARVRLGKATPDMLTIKRGTFKSFRATVNGKRPSFGVTQVK